MGRWVLGAENLDALISMANLWRRITIKDVFAGATEILEVTGDKKILGAQT